MQNHLKEQLESIEQTRTVWHMQLDHQRNRVLRINLLIRYLGPCFLVLLLLDPRRQSCWGARLPADAAAAAAAASRRAHVHSGRKC